MMALNVTYLSQGKLFFKSGDSPARQVESSFGQEVINRSLQRYQKREWKAKGQGSPFSGGALWGMHEGDPSDMVAQITGVTRGDQAGQLLYALAIEGAGGLFVYDWADSQEKRLFHREHFYVRDLDRHPTLGLVVCSQALPNRTAHLGLIKGLHLHPLTEGDAIDEAPRWIPGDEQELVFQSAGVARNKDGYPLGLGPFAVHQLNMDTGAMKMLLEDPAFDFLLPHLDAAGNLYFIRRPYEAPGHAPFSFLKFLQDMVLFPYRLVRAIVHFLNFFSLIFSKKPLMTASNLKMEGPDERMVMLRGRVIDAQKAWREAAQKKEAPSLVPDSWKLVRRSPAGDEQVLADHVVAFDLDAQGRIVYTNGSVIYQLNPGGQPRQLDKGNLIEEVMIMGESQSVAAA
jgi:hypothetical protein